MEQRDAGASALGDRRRIRDNIISEYNRAMYNRMSDNSGIITPIMRAYIVTSTTSQHRSTSPITTPLLFDSIQSVANRRERSPHIPRRKYRSAQLVKYLHGLGRIRGEIIGVMMIMNKKVMAARSSNGRNRLYV
jgi:hypothetical protein